jgi:hypothetical protein
MRRGNTGAPKLKRQGHGNAETTPIWPLLAHEPIQARNAKVPQRAGVSEANLQLIFVSRDIYGHALQKVRDAGAREAEPKATAQMLRAHSTERTPRRRSDEVEKRRIETMQSD